MRLITKRSIQLFYKHLKYLSYIINKFFLSLFTFFLLFISFAFLLLFIIILSLCFQTFIVIKLYLYRYLYQIFVIVNFIDLIIKNYRYINIIAKIFNKLFKKNIIDKI